jgi:hypothetical protein
MDNSPEAAMHLDKASPTARVESILMTLAIARAKGRRCTAMDICNAYLEASMGSEELFVEFYPSVVNASKRLNSDLGQYADDNGRVVAKLNKVRYGCV